MNINQALDTEDFSNRLFSTLNKSENIYSRQEDLNNKDNSYDDLSFNSFKDIFWGINPTDKKTAKDDKSQDINSLSPELLQMLKELVDKKKLSFNFIDIYDIESLRKNKDLFKIEDKDRFDLSNLTKEDVDFIKQSLDNPNMLINPIQNPQINLSVPNQSGQVLQSNLNISKDFFNVIDYAFKSQKPVRLDFEGNSSLILRISTEGKLSAEFISSNEAMKNLIKDGIPRLKDKLDSEGIPYNDIFYRDDNKKQNRNNKQDQKENDQ